MVDPVPANSETVLAQGGGGKLKKKHKFKKNKSNKKSKKIQKKYKKPKGKRKSVQRKSIRRKSVQRKSTRRKSTRRKSIRRKSTRRRRSTRLRGGATATGPGSGGDAAAASEGAPVLPRIVPNAALRLDPRALRAHAARARRLRRLPGRREGGAPVLPRIVPNAARVTPVAGVTTQDVKPHNRRLQLHHLPAARKAMTADHEKLKELRRKKNDPSTSFTASQKLAEDEEELVRKIQEREKLAHEVISADGTCSDTAHTTRTHCEGAGETWTRNG